MGIKNLYKLITDYAPDSITNTKISDYKNKVIVIDASLVIYQYVIAIRNTGNDFVNNNGEMTTHILGIVNKSLMLLNLDILPIFVFDGKAPKLKKLTLKNRKLLKEKNLKKLEDCDYDNEEDRIKIFKKCYTITKEHKLQIKEMLDLFGIPFFESSTEADVLCAQLVKENKAYAVSSEDMDILTFGSPILIRGLSQKKSTKEINLMKVLKDFNMSTDEFIDLCILLGCDYLPTIPRIGPKRAFDLIKYYGSIENFLENESSKYNIPEDFNYIEVRNYFKKEEDIKNVGEIKLKLPKYNQIKDLMLNKYNFNEIKVNRMIKKIKIFYNKFKCHMDIQ